MASYRYQGYFKSLQSKRMRRAETAAQIAEKIFAVCDRADNRDERLREVFVLLDRWQIDQEADVCNWLQMELGELDFCLQKISRQKITRLRKLVEEKLHSKLKKR